MVGPNGRATSRKALEIALGDAPWLLGRHFGSDKVGGAGAEMLVAGLRGAHRGINPKGLAAEQLIGTDQRTLKDSTGKAFGEELYAAAQKPEGQFTEVVYLFPRPGADATPVKKVSLVTRVGDLGCG